jgi:hypothetical protein
MKTSLLALPLLALGLPSALPLLGPPTLCVPLDIGKAASLPLAEGDRPEGSPGIQDLPARCLEILAKDQDPELHFETLRRAALRLMSERRQDRDRVQKARRAAEAIDAGLVEVLLRLESREGSTAGRRALAWLDLGLHRLNMRIAGLRAGDPDWALFDKATRLAPRDPSLRICLFAANFGMRPGKVWEEDLRAWLGLRDRADERTTRNLLLLTGHFLSIRDLPTLQARYAAKGGSKVGSPADKG